MSQAHVTPTEASSGGRAAAPPPTRFGSYELVRKLGAGGMGVVYEARRVGLQKRVAIKMLTAFEGAASARFLQEARIAATLEHPHVVDCIDVGSQDGVPYLAMEFLEGETLRERLARGPMRTEEAVEVVLPVLSAIASAHDRDIIHRDLKPENIFLAQRLGETVPKVLDFGIAKCRAPDNTPGLTQTAAIIGTPGYMAPEQAMDSKRVTPASDQFALGSVLWCCVAGQELYVGEAPLEVLFALVHDAPRPLSSVAPTAPKGFCDVVMRMLSRDPAARFSNLRDVGNALLPYAAPTARARWEREFGATRAPTPQPPSPAPSSRPAKHLGLQDTLASGEILPPVRAVPTPLSSSRRGVAIALVLVGLAIIAGMAFTRGGATSGTAAPPTPAARTATRPAPTPVAVHHEAPPSVATPTPPPVAATPPAEPPPSTEAPSLAHTAAPRGDAPHATPRRPHLRHRNL